MFRSQSTALFISCIAMALFAGSCNKSTDFTNKVYFSQSVASPIVPVLIDGAKGTVSLTLVSAQLATENLEVGVTVLDDSYLKSFNEKNGTNYVMAPASTFELSASAVSIPAGKAAADRALTVTVNNSPKYVDGVQYAIPVQIASKGGADILPGSDVVVVSINKIINTVAAHTTDRGFSATSADIMGKTGSADNITIEGKFILTKDLAVPGNWRSDIFTGFGMQLAVFRSGGIDIRFPNAAFMFNERPPTSTKLNTWTHFAITYKDNAVTLCINGEQSGSSVTYAGLTIGGLGIAGYTNGCAVSEFRIWDHVRTRKQIKTFACAVDPATPGLRAYWRFNEGSGTTIKDVSGNGHDIVDPSAFTWLSDVKCP